MQHENHLEQKFLSLYLSFYLIYSIAKYDKQKLAAYKSFDDYCLFDEGYVESLMTTVLRDEGMHLFIGKVRPSMNKKTDDSKKFYDVWFILEGKGNNRGKVLMARCTCKGGQDGGCKHIATSETKPCDIEDLRIRRS